MRCRQLTHRRYDAAQTRRCLAIITYVLRNSISTPETPTTFSYNDSAVDRIACLRAAFTAYSKIVDVIDASQRADLCAVVLHLFGDLLKDETPHMDLPGKCLPALKVLLDQALGASVQVPGVTTTGDKIVHGLLSACLSNIDDMRSAVITPR